MNTEMLENCIWCEDAPPRLLTNWGCTETSSDYTTFKVSVRVMVKDFPAERYVKYLYMKADKYHFTIKEINILSEPVFYERD